MAWRNTLLILLPAVILGCREESPQPRPPEPVTPRPSSPPSNESAAASDDLSEAFSTPTSDPTILEAPGVTAPKPARWTWQPPSMEMRDLQYAVPSMGEAPAAELVVSFFPPPMLGGPIDANLERWRQQFTDDQAMPETAEAEVRVIDGMTVHLIELRGRYQGMGAAAPRPGWMQLGAIVEGPKGNLYIRLLGPAPTVEFHRDEFNTMIEGLRSTEKIGGDGE